MTDHPGMLVLGSVKLDRTENSSGCDEPFYEFVVQACGACLENRLSLCQQRVFETATEQDLRAGEQISLTLVFVTVQVKERVKEMMRLKRKLFLCVLL